MLDNNLSSKVGSDWIQRWIQTGIFQVIVFVHFCCPQKEFSFFGCDTGMTSRTTTPCALRKPWARTKEPTPALLRIEWGKWKPLPRSRCEVSVPRGAGPVSHTDNCFLMGWATSFPAFVWVTHALAGMAAALLYSVGEILVLLISQAKS